VRKKSYVMLGSLPIRPALQLCLNILSLIPLASAFVLTFTIFALAGTAQEIPTTQRSSREVQSAASSQPFAAPLLPFSPLAPGQAQPSAPQVSYDGKQLTITADNSTLSDILAAVRARTGAEIDLPASASSERIAAVHLGPGPAREMLATLLSWTGFDYVIQASDADPLAIQSVLLAVRSKTAAGVATGGAAASARQPLSRTSRRVTEPNPSTAETPEPENSVPQQPGTPVEIAPPDQQSAPTVPESNPNQPQPPKTPEQMIQELQQLYQQRRQIQQQQLGQKLPSGT
jgi:hypothetical protein